MGTCASVAAASSCEGPKTPPCARSCALRLSLTDGGSDPLADGESDPILPTHASMTDQHLHAGGLNGGDGVDGHSPQPSDPDHACSGSWSRARHGDVGPSARQDDHRAVDTMEAAALEACAPSVDNIERTGASNFIGKLEVDGFAGADLGSLKDIRTTGRGLGTASHSISPMNIGNLDDIVNDNGVTAQTCTYSSPGMPPTFV